MSKEPLSPVNDALQLVFLFGNAAVTSPGLLKNRSVWALEEAYRSGEDFDTGWYTCGRDNWLAQIFRSGDTVTCRSVMTASGANDDYEGQYTESIKIAKTTHPQRALKLILEMMTEVSQNAFLDFLRDRERKQKGRNVFYHPLSPPPARNPAALNDAFKRWFGNSVVRNEDGSPKVVYHGTDKQFSKFNIERCELGCHFGTKTQAEDMPARKIIIPCYLSIQNPLRLQDPINWTPASVLYQENFPATQDKIDAITVSEPPREIADRMMRELVLKAGYDGIVYLNRREGYYVYLTDKELRGGARALGYDDTGDYEELTDRVNDSDFKKLSPNAQDSYIAFYPWQIKSIDNDGTWDRDDPNIGSNPPCQRISAMNIPFNTPQADIDRCLEIEASVTEEELPLYLDCMNGVPLSVRVKTPRDCDGRDVYDGCILTGVFMHCRSTIESNPPVPAPIPIALKRAADRVASTLADEQSENYRSLDFCEPIAQRAWELFAELGIDAPVANEGSHHFNEVTFLGKTYTVDFWERVYDDQGEPMPDEESGSGYLCSIKRPPEIRLKLTSSNPDRVYSLKHVIEHLHRTDGTGDPDWLKYLERLVAPFKKWEIDYVDPSEIDNECGDQETAEEYADDFDSLPPVVLIPSDTGGDRFEVVDGSHRIFAASILGVTIQAYIPVGTRTGR